MYFKRLIGSLKLINIMKDRTNAKDLFCFLANRRFSVLYKLLSEGPYRPLTVLACSIPLTVDSKYVIKKQIGRSIQAILSTKEKHTFSHQSGKHFFFNMC